MGKWNGHLKQLWQQQQMDDAPHMLKFERGIFISTRGAESDGMAALPLGGGLVDSELCL